MVLKTFPTAGPSSSSTAMTTTATSTRIKAYSTNPCPLCRLAQNMLSPPFRLVPPNHESCGRINLLPTLYFSFCAVLVWIWLEFSGLARIGWDPRALSNLQALQRRMNGETEWERRLTEHTSGHIIPPRSATLVQPVLCLACRLCAHNQMRRVRWDTMTN